MAGFINTPAAQRQAPTQGARQPVAEPKSTQTRSVAGIAVGGAAATAGAHIPPVGAAVSGSLLSRPLRSIRRAVANIAAFSPLEFGAYLTRPAATETATSRATHPPEPPAATPRKPTVTPPDPDAPPAVAEVAKWTEADITEHPEFDAPARPGAPATLTAKAKGFASKSQWRKFFADPALRKYAHRKAEASKGGPKVRYRVLPERKSAPLR